MDDYQLLNSIMLYGLVTSEFVQRTVNYYACLFPLATTSQPFIFSHATVLLPLLPILLPPNMLIELHEFGSFLL